MLLPDPLEYPRPSQELYTWLSSKMQGAARMWFMISDEVLIQPVDDDLVILNLATEQYHALNSTARVFLEICRSSNSRSDAISKILSAFEIGREEAEQDLEVFIGHLEKRGILTTRAPK